jgi:archaellum component FlaC
MDKSEELTLFKLLQKHSAALQNHRDCIQDVIVVLENLADRISKLEKRVENLSSSKSN